MRLAEARSGARLCEPQQRPQFHTLEFIPTRPGGAAAPPYHNSAGQSCRFANFQTVTITASCDAADDNLASVASKRQSARRPP